MTSNGGRSVTQTPRQDPRSIVVYIAGPYRASTWGQVKANVAHAMDVAAEILHMGYSMICPHSMTHEFEMYKLPDDAFLTSDLVLLSRCDLVLVLDDWKNSSGTKAEVAFAQGNAIPILYEQHGAWREQIDEIAQDLLRNKAAWQHVRDSALQN